MSRPEYSLYLTVKIFSLYIAISLRRADVIMTVSKKQFLLYPRWKKANTVSVNNFNKIKNMFIIFCRQH